MSTRKIKRALISVYDKTGIVDFARALVDEFKIEIISTGGTAKLLKENKIPAQGSVPKRSCTSKSPCTSPGTATARPPTREACGST